MLERLKDKVAEIRAQAVTALQRLQDPKDEECPIIRAYLFHLAHDPNNIVRRTIGRIDQSGHSNLMCSPMTVRCIGATRLTLPHILERTRDIDDHVRRAAYKFLAEKVTSILCSIVYFNNPIPGPHQESDHQPEGRSAEERSGRPKRDGQESCGEGDDPR